MNDGLTPPSPRPKTCRGATPFRVAPGVQSPRPHYASLFPSGAQKTRERTIRETATPGEEHPGVQKPRPHPPFGHPLSRRVQLSRHYTTRSSTALPPLPHPPQNTIDFGEGDRRPSIVHGLLSLKPFRQPDPRPFGDLHRALGGFPQDIFFLCYDHIVITHQPFPITHNRFDVVRLHR